MEDTWLKNFKSVFISYSWKDKPLLNSVINEFEASKISFWIDSNELKLDSPLEPQIRNGILQARNFLLLDTKNSRESDWVNFEISLAKKFFRKNEFFILKNKNDLIRIKQIICSQSTKR